MALSIFNVENKLWVFLRRMTDVFLLSMLQVLFSLPIVTAGAAMSGFHYGAMKIIHDTESGVWRDFIKGFKSSFKVSTLCWILQLVVSAVALLNIYICFAMMKKIGYVFMGFNIFVLLFVLMVSFYAYPIAAKYKFGVKKVIHDAVVSSVVHFPQSIGIVLFAALMIYLSIKVRYVFVIALFVVEYQASRVSDWVFEGLEKAEEEQVSR